MSTPSTDTEYSSEELDADLRYWSAANYLTVAQIYLQDNVLLRRPLEAKHIKPKHVIRAPDTHVVGDEIKNNADVLGLQSRCKLTETVEAAQFGTDRGMVNGVIAMCAAGPRFQDGR